MGLAPGHRLGRYRVVTLVGTGGMGEVYRAHDPELGREVAIKVLPAEVADDPERLARFEREARAIGQVSHPNLLAVHDVGRHDGASYLVCELLEGRTLRERLASGPLSPREALDHASQIASGLAAAHERGVIHRDLKPENVFLTREGRVKILDFGLAKLVAPEDPDESRSPTLTTASGRGAMLGTVSYMSPEQAAGRPVDHRADQFALGTILYEMLTGSRPFDGRTIVETLTAILRDEPEPLGGAAPSTPTPLRWIAERCLAKDPNGRYDATSDLARELRMVAERLPELTGGVAPGSLPRPTFRKRASVAALILVLAVLAALAGFLAGRSATERPQPAYERITFRRGTVTAARFDADGRSVLYSAAWEGAPSHIFLWRPGDSDSLPVGPAQSHLLSVSPAGELLLLTEVALAGPFHRVGRLARMPVTGAPRVLDENVAEAVLGPDGDLLAVVRDVEGQALLEYPPGRQVHSTRGVVKYLRTSPDGSRIAFGEFPQRGSNSGPIVVLERAGGSTRLETMVRDGLAWSASGREIWFANVNELRAVTPNGEERLVAKFPMRVALFDISPQGRVLVSFEQQRWEMAGRPRGGKERSLTWLAWSLPFDISRDGDAILFNECSGPCRVSLRGFDEAPPVALGEGFGVSLSPDGRQVLSATPWNPSELSVIATQTGDRRTFPLKGIERVELAVWSPDARTVFFTGNAPGKGNRIFRLSLEGGAPEPVTPEGIEFGYLAVSPDGRHAAAKRVEGGIAIYPIGGEGEPRLLALEEYPIRWSGDGRFLYTAPLSVAPATVHRVDLDSGAVETVASLMPSDPAGVVQVSPIAITPDGEAYVYGYQRQLSDLFVVEGLE